VDDGTCRVCVFNFYFESKGLDGRSQEVGRIPDSILLADGKKPQESKPTDSDDVYKYCASGIRPDSRGAALYFQGGRAAIQTTTLLD
ncbi:MAG: hypothetical protein EZS28_023311, partial [Streblomastix strix]